MRILKHIAQDIVEQTSEILPYPISITDHEGYIIGATDKSRIGLFHQPSLEVIKKNIMVDCRSEIEKKILPGVSVPIKFNHKIIGVLGIVGEPREVEKYGQLVKNQVEMMCQEAFRKEMVELKEKMVEIFVHQMVHYKQDDDPANLLQYAKLLEFDTNIERVCLLIDINKLSADRKKEGVFKHSSFQNFQREVLDFLHLLFYENKGDICSFLPNHFIVLKSLPFHQSYSSFIDSLEEKLNKINLFLEKKYHVSAWLSVGNISRNIEEVSESYMNAMNTMRLKINSGQNNGIHLYNEHEMMLHQLPRELSSDYQKKLLQSINPLFEHDSYEVLAATFTAFCKYNMKLSEASRNLYVHRNTIIYRLEKIREITSLDTSNFEHCMLLYTAIQCYEEQKVEGISKSKANVQ